MSRSTGRIGWFLVWAVVYSDIGASVYYVPGMLSGSVGAGSGLFVTLTMLVFCLLCVKVVEVSRRFSNGGGVVSVAEAAFGPWWGGVGGLLSMVDYFLTVAICAASAMYYLDTVFPLGAALLPATLACVAALCGMNIVGIKESALASTVLAGSAFVVNVVVIGTALASAPSEVLVGIPKEFLAVQTLAPWQVLVGYGGAWLAFSGLESLSQLAPALRDVQETPRRGLVAVVATVLMTVPVLTLLSVVSPSGDPTGHGSQRFISALAAVWGGRGLELAVGLTASSLLLFAANTAIIGNYHVQLALTRRARLPGGLAALSHRYQTPYRAIVLGTAVPAALLVLVNGSLASLGDLYAFGLLGSLVLTSTGIDVLRWRDGERGVGFWVGVGTSAAVLLAFCVNLAAKPLAVAFGGGLGAVGMLIALGTHSGWFARTIARIPRMAPPREVLRTEILFYTLAQATELGREAHPGILVASRGATRKIFREAGDRAKSRGEQRLYLLYVDEIPGLFYPQLAAPTPEGLTVLEAGCEVIRELGLEPVPVWGLSHSAPQTVVEAAEGLGCDTVVIGATQRTFLWHALRGRFIQDLLRLLPAHIRLIVVG